MSDEDKSEQNPYESSREPKPLTKIQIVKRAMGVGTIILLTPPAMIVAVWCCCSGATWVANGFSPVLAFGGPFVVLTALMTTGFMLDRSRESNSDLAGLRIALFIATPFVVAMATVIGFFMAASGFSSAWVFVYFYTPPTIALLLMLTLIWRTK